jgi:hypothetical protein
LQARQCSIDIYSRNCLLDLLSEIISSITGFRYLVIVAAQFVSGFATAMLTLFIFLIAVSGGPQIILGYYSKIPQALFSANVFFAGFALAFGSSPILAVAFQLVKRKYSERDWMRASRSAFFLGVLLGAGVVAIYIIFLGIALTDPQKFGPGAGGGVGA